MHWDLIQLCKYHVQVLLYIGIFYKMTSFVPLFVSLKLAFKTYNLTRIFYMTDKGTLNRPLQR